jgi:hypothetical protein
LKVEVARSDKFKALIGAIALALVVALLAPPAVQAAVQKIKGTVTAKIKDTGGGNINSKKIAAQGLFDAPGSPGALDVRTFGAGNGFLTAGNCAGAPLPASRTVPRGVVTAIIVTGTDATVGVQSAAVGAFDLLRFETTAANPNVAFSLGNGLKATDALTFTCSGADGRFVLIGQDN